MSVYRKKSSERRDMNPYSANREQVLKCDPTETLEKSETALMSVTYQLIGPFEVLLGGKCTSTKGYRQRKPI